MSIYVIGDLHLSFNNPKPMDIFGDNWNNYEKKIKENWLENVKQDDTVILLGDFSWEMHLKETLKDFEYINSLPGKKILVKGNHDYWWTTKTNMANFLNDNKLNNIYFLQNNSFLIEDKIIVGTRGWDVISDKSENGNKMIKREVNRLEISIEDGIKNFGSSYEIIACTHYPPIVKSNIIKNETTEFMQIMKKYNIKKCYYGHLHGQSIKDAVEGNIDGIDLKLVSADGVDFKLQKI